MIEGFNGELVQNINRKNHINIYHEINELDSLSSSEDNIVPKENEKENLLFYTNYEDEPSSYIYEHKEPSTYLMKIEKQHLPKYKQRKSLTAISSNKLNKEKEAFYQRLSRPKRINKEDVRSHSKDNSINVSRLDKSIGEKACHRLYEMSNGLIVKKEKMKRDHQDSLYSQYSFKPQIKRIPTANDNNNLFERFKAFELDKQKSLLKKIEEKKKQEESKFHYKPSINKKSIEICNQLNQKNDDINVYERLYTENIYNIKTIQLNKDEIECTFNPKRVTSSNNLSTNNNLNTFLQKQDYYIEERRANKERLVLDEELKQLKEYSFKPQINSASEFLASFNSETSEEKYHRMSRLAMEQNELKKQQLQEFYDNQYQYKPITNSNYSISPNRAKSTTKTSKDYSRISDQDTTYCTFKPFLYKKKFPDIQSQYKYDENIMPRINNELRQKEKKLNLVKQQLDERDIKECKFKPAINEYIPTEQLIESKGFDKYVNQMEKLRQKKKEEDERNKAIFFTSEYCQQKPFVLTKPQPFNLSKKYNSNYQNQLTKKDE